MSATVPPIIYVMYGCSAAIYNGFKPVLPQRRQAYTRACANIIYILYRETTTATLRIKILAVNIF
jgi:hypothetical protein